MYKATYRFLQRLVEQGRKLTGPPRSKQHGKPRAWRARALDQVAEEAKLKSWVAYIRRCRESNVKQRVPADVLATLKRRRLLP